MNKLLLLALASLAFAFSASAQSGFRFDSQVTQVATILTTTNAVVVPAGPIIKVCNAPANAVPCSNLATTYTDSTLATSCSSNVQLVLSGTNTCVSSPDAQNNWGVWVASGQQYTYTITVNGQNFGPYFFTAGGGGGGGGSPGGSEYEMQYNGGSSTFAGAPGITTPDGYQLPIAGPVPFADFTSPAYGMPASGRCDDQVNDNWTANEAAGAYGSINSGSQTWVYSSGYKAVLKLGCGIFVGNAGAMTTMSAPTIIGVYNHGTAGSTTYSYQVACVDWNFGTSPASPSVSTTTGNASLSQINFNNPYWAWDTAHCLGYLVYRGGTLIGETFHCQEAASYPVCGYVDDGVTHLIGGQTSDAHFLPQTPPGSNTADALYAIITVISGNNYTLSIAATTAATGFAQADESIFLDAVANTGFGDAPTEILVPHGTYNLSHIPQISSPNVHIVIQGDLQLFAGPMNIPAQLRIEGDGPPIAITGIPPKCINVATPTWLPAVITTPGTPGGGIIFGGFCAGALSQDGVIQNASGSYYHDLGMTQVGGGDGVNFEFGANVIFTKGQTIYANNTNISGPQNILFRCQVAAGSLGNTMQDVSLVGQALGADFASGYNPASSGCYSQLAISGNSTLESDTAIGALNILPGAYAESWNVQINSSDGPNTLCGIKVYQGGHNIYNTVNSVPGQGICDDNNPTNAPQAGGGSTVGQTSSPPNYTYGADFASGSLVDGYNSVINWTNVNTGQTAFSSSFYKPYLSTSAGTGGSLSAGTYYIKGEMYDVRGIGYFTPASPEVTQTVSSGGTITVTETEYLAGASGCVAFIGLSAGGENVYFTGSMTSYDTCSVTITSTSGTSGTPQNAILAMRGFLNLDFSQPDCWPCGYNGVPSEPFGIGLNISQYGTMAGSSTKYSLWTGSQYTFGHVQFPGLSTSTGSIAGSVCQDSSGNLIYYAGNNCESGGGGGSSALSSITAATTSNSINSGNNGSQLWEWQLTSNNTVGFELTEPSASTGTGTYIFKLATLAGSTASPLIISNSLTGSQTLCALCLTPTWNTSGVVDAAIFLNVTNTASGTGSLLADLQVGGTSQFSVDKAGNATAKTSLNTGSGASSAGGSGGIGFTEAAATGWTPTTGQDYCRADSTAHQFLCSVNDGSEFKGIGPQNAIWLECSGKGLGDGYNAIPAQTYLQYTCRNNTGVTVTITGVNCLTDNAGSTTVNAAGNSLGALLTAAITCSTSYVSGTQSSNVLFTSGDYIKFTIVTDGGSKQVDINVLGKY